MHTIWMRLNAISFFGFSVLLVMSMGCANSTWFHQDTTKVKTLELSQLRTFKNNGQVDRALLSFDIEAQLSGAFNWNIHQLFAYVVAEYASEECPYNQVVVWDQIIKSSGEADLHDDNVFSKYALVDHGMGLRGTNVTLKLYWDHMPLTGSLFINSGSSARSSFVLPKKYVS